MSTLDYQKSYKQQRIAKETMDIYAPQNFIVGEDGITFIYNPYEIAPYTKGNTELTLSYDTLRAIMK